jgi:Zn-dependent protease
MDAATVILVLVIVVFSSIVHEVMHGYAAYWLGDLTARYAGRLTLNPLPHIDPFGSVILPLLLVLGNSPIFFGYAKPVPYNPYNLRPGRFSEAIVAGAGPFSNLVIALAFGLLIRTGVFGAFTDILFLVVAVNTMLFFFNMIPVPPIDGSKVLESLLPRSWAIPYASWRRRMEMNPLAGMVIVVLLVFFLGDLWSNFLFSAASLIAGR